MTVQENQVKIWRFGVFEVDASNLGLRRSGVSVKIREQSFRVLVYLLEHAGEIVSREDLRRVLWPADTFVDFDHSLNSAMMKLREVLGDVAEAPIYIETIPKRGYRFIAPVTRPGDGRSEAVSPPIVAPPVPDSEPVAPRGPSVFRFADVEVHEREFSLLKAGETLPVEPKAFRVLLILLRNPQKLIPKEELLNSVWSDVAVTENSLTRAVALLRRLLEDDARTPRFIETVATVGYRFLVRVEVAEDRSGQPVAPVVPPLLPSAKPRFSIFHSHMAIAAGLLLIAIAGIGSFILMRFTASKRNESKAAPAVLRIVPITTAPGDAIFPAFSPDGREIAFVWDGPERMHYDLYVQLIGSEPPLKLTNTESGIPGLPVWSPDGRQLAFMRCYGGTDGV